MIIARNEVELLSDGANVLFGRAPRLSVLTPSGKQYDYSLGALIRAIVINKCPERVIANDAEDMTDVGWLRTGTSEGTSEKMLNPEWALQFFRTLEAPLTIMAVTDSSFGALESQLRERINNKETSYGWETFDGNPLFINRYLSQFEKSMVIMHRERRQVIAIVDGDLTELWLQAFESMLWALMPWYFPEKTPETMEFFKKISVDNKQTAASALRAREAFLKYVNDAAKQIDLRSLNLHKLLDGIADEVRQSQISSYQSKYDETSDAIERRSTELEALYKSIDQIRQMLSALENQAPSTDDTMFKFFNEHKNLTLVEVRETTLHYCVTDTLEYYDVDELKRILANENSWLCRAYSQDTLKYIKALFVEKRGIIKVTADFMLSGLKMVHSVRGTVWNYNEAMPNPHIYYYGCDGANGQYYSKYAQTGDWDLGIEQSISATKNWSVGDSAVGIRMMQWLSEHRCNNEMKFIYVDDGKPMTRVSETSTLVSMAEFIEMINKQDEKAESTQEGESNG